MCLSCMLPKISTQIRHRDVGNIVQRHRCLSRIFHAHKHAAPLGSVQHTIAPASEDLSESSPPDEDIIVVEGPCQYPAGCRRSLGETSGSRPPHEDIHLVESLYELPSWLEILVAASCNSTDRRYAESISRDEGVVVTYPTHPMNATKSRWRID